MLKLIITEDKKTRVGWCELNILDGYGGGTCINSEKGGENINLEKIHMCLYFFKKVACMRFRK